MPTVRTWVCRALSSSWERSVSDGTQQASTASGLADWDWFPYCQDKYKTDSLCGEERTYILYLPSTMSISSTPLRISYFNYLPSTSHPQWGCCKKFPLRSGWLKCGRNEEYMRRSACRNTTEIPNIVNLSAYFPPPTLNFSLFQDTFRHTLQISDQIPPDLAECGLKLCISSQTGNSPFVCANVKFLHTPEGMALTLYSIS